MSESKEPKSIGYTDGVDPGKIEYIKRMSRHIRGYEGLTLSQINDNYNALAKENKLVSHTAIGTPIISSLRKFLCRVQRTPLRDRIIFSYSTPLEKKPKKVSLEKCLLLVCLQQHGRMTG